MNILSKLTRNYLKLNKKRTIVTIIGIILAGAMISAVATLTVSFQAFLINVEEKNEGKWQASFYDVKYEDVKYIQNNKKYEQAGIIAPYLMAKNNYSDEQYLEVKALDQEAFQNMGIKLQQGRLPQNTNEIALSKSFFDGKENEPKVGDTITLETGNVMVDNENVTENTKLTSEAEKEFKKTGEKTFTITGIIAKPNFEGGSDYTSGVTVLDNTTIAPEERVEVGVIAKKTNKIYEDTEKTADDLGAFTNLTEEQKEMVNDTKTKQKGKLYHIRYNKDVLMYYGVSDNSGFIHMIYLVSGILIAVIAIGSILVIYNSFAISVSERKKQFGMLSSVGATKKQIRKSVLYEGAVLGIIGIPVGILSGIGGIGITLKIVDGLLQPMLHNPDGQDWALRLIISWPAILIAIVLIALTIFMSVIIPARRASKISPIEAIRQSDDIKVKAKKLKTPKFIRKLFGEEGEIALKNLKRSKKRYRTTVVSLIISIILYISVTSFVDYMFKGFDTIYEVPDYDISARVNNSKYTPRCEEALAEIKNITSTKEMVAARQMYSLVKLEDSNLSSKFKSLLEKEKRIQYNYTKEDGKYEINTGVVTLNKEQQDKYLKELGINELRDDQIILIDISNDYAKTHAEYNLTNYKEGDKLTIYENVHYGSDSEKKPKQIEFEIAKTTDKFPFGFNSTNLGLLVITTEKGLENVSNLETKPYIQCFSYIKTEDSNRKEVLNQLNEIAKKYSDINVNIFDVKQNIEQNANLKLIIQIFLYGFIVLISAIGISNIFNTISTNINLRRREFANLKSIGMTDKQFKRMLDLECFFYGTKALLYGLPISIGISFLLNKAFSSGIDFMFHLPWKSMGVVIVAVYLIVFITMLYSSRKVKKENIIDVLRDDNV